MGAAALRPAVARALLAAPVLAALTVAWGDLPRAVGAEPDDDPLGYVVDRDALDDPRVIAAGRELYVTGCSSCHGMAGAGTAQGPPLVDSGAAAAHFYLTSGRMPQASEGQSERKRPAYPPDEIEALVAYVASLGDGPPIPDVDLESGDLAEGGVLYRLNCAACHSAAGSGGALSYGRNAPTLQPVTAVQMAEAIRIGPGQMPRFPEESYDDEDLNAMVRYALYLQDPDDHGGLALGRIGPIPEGFLAIAVGTGLTLVAALWIGRRHVTARADTKEEAP